MKQSDFGHGTEKDSKNKLVQQYRMQKLWEQCAQTDFERWRRYQAMQIDAEKNRCPACRRTIAVLDGRIK